MLIQDMLKEYGFFVEEECYTQEDFNEIGTRKQELMAMGITNVPINLKREFIAEFSLTKSTSIFVKGQYLRKPSGEKMYSSYYYTYYKEIKNLYFGTKRTITIVRTANKRTLLNDFEHSFCHKTKRALGGNDEF
ncbi:hypothetical protein [Enterococcus faecalis]|uniref:hypothetical protein n=1 Tax=Enterococcus faecalis TaxID=1351 RepID=UPI0025B06ED3|nr:hypothetical protein [Enterococcus faecalis]